MIQSEFWWFFGSFLQAGCPSCVSGEGSWISINDMTEITNIVSKAITFLLHQVSYTLAHSVWNFCCCCLSRSRFVYTSILYFVAVFAFCCEICCYRFYTDTIKMCRHQNVASYFCGCRFFLISVLFLWPSRVKRCQITDLFFSRPRDLMLWISSLAEQRTQGQSTNLGPDLQNILRFMISLT